MRIAYTIICHDLLNLIYFLLFLLPVITIFMFVCIVVLGCSVPWNQHAQGDAVNNRCLVLIIKSLPADRLDEAVLLAAAQTNSCSEIS